MPLLVLTAAGEKEEKIRIRTSFEFYPFEKTDVICIKDNFI